MSNQVVEVTADAVRIMNRTKARDFFEAKVGPWPSSAPLLRIESIYRPMNAAKFSFLFKQRAMAILNSPLPRRTLRTRMDSCINCR
jgi:hypothetical protein